MAWNPISPIGASPKTQPIPTSTPTPSGGWQPIGGNSITSTPTSPPAPTTPAPTITPSTASGYGASNLTDPASGKPLLTFENPVAKSSQLLSDRTAPPFDPTVAQKVDPSVLQDPRMAESVSQAIKTSIGGSNYEELDHIMPLELGGSNNKSNLRLESGDNPNAPYSSSNPTPTDPLEDSLASQVQNGQISLVQAWNLMAQAKGLTLPEQGGTVPNINQTQNDQDVDTDTQPNEFNNSLPGDVLTNAPATISTLADLQTNPLSLGSSLKQIIETPFTDAQTASDNYNAALGAFLQGIKTNAPASQKISEGLQVATTLGAGALYPITTWFNVASKIPIVGSITKLIFNLPFALLGDVSGDVGVSAMNQIPDSVLSQDAKTNLEPGVRAVSTLAGQIIGGKYIAPDILKTLQDTFGAKDANTIKTQAEDLANQVKENPPPPDDGGPKPSLSEIAEEEPKEPAPKESNIAPKQNTETVDLSDSNGKKPVQDITAPVRPRTPMDAVIEKFTPPIKTTADIIPKDTPVTVKGSSDFKMSSDDGSGKVQVVNLKTGNEETVPKDQVQPAETPSENPNEEIVKKRTVNSLRPIEGTGEVKTRGLSKSVEAGAIQNGLADTLGDLPEYRTVDMKDQANKVQQLIEDDPAKAKRIAMGDENAPKGIIPEAVHTALRLQAAAEGDGELAKDLANSKLTSQATTFGQRINALKGANPEDPVAAIKEVQDAREEAQKGKAEAEAKKAADSIKQATKDRVSGKTKVDWSSFIENLKC